MLPNKNWSFQVQVKFVRCIPGGQTLLTFISMVADMADIGRKQAKTINLGLFYGMGKGKLMSQLGVDLEDSYRTDLLTAYHQKVSLLLSN